MLLLANSNKETIIHSQVLYKITCPVRIAENMHVFGSTRRRGDYMNVTSQHRNSQLLLSLDVTNRQETEKPIKAAPTVLSKVIWSFMIEGVGSKERKCGGQTARRYRKGEKAEICFQS